MNDLFDPSQTEAEVVNELSKMRFTKIGEGHSAHVFGDTNNRVVLKVFPPLNVGTAKELSFIQRNPLLRHANRLSLQWGKFRIVQRARQIAKSHVARVLSRGRVEQRLLASQSCIRGYRACTDKGLMTRLPTRVIPNCLSRLSVGGHGRAMAYLVAPSEIVMQARFHESDVAISVLRKGCMRNDAMGGMHELIEKVMEYQLVMWEMGLVSTDLSCNVFENSIILADGSVQLHDANDVTGSLASAQWFIREKEQDLHRIFSRFNNGEYPKCLYDTDLASIAETARRLHQVLPARHRDDLVMRFLESARTVLCKQTFEKHWESR